MMRQQTSKIGLIGCGKWGKHVLRDLLSLGAEVHVAAPLAATRDYALQQGAKAAYADVEHMNEVDGYVVVTPTASHAQLVERLLPTGKPVFVEKPLCTDPADAMRIVEQAGERVFVMDKWRYHPGIQKIAELVQTGVLGKILSVRISRLGWNNPHADVDSLFILLPHDLSILLHVLGRIPAVRSAVKSAASPPDGGMIALLGGEADPMITLEISIVTPEHRRSFTFVGERATVQLADSYETRILLRRGPPGAPAVETENLSADGPLPLLQELQIFVEYLQGGPSPMSTAREGLLIVQRIMEIRRLLGLCE